MADYGRDKGLFIPTTQVWDPSEIYSAKGISEDLRDVLVKMYQNLNNMAMAINQKDTGIYPTDEFVCGQTFFPNPAYDSGTQVTPKLRQIWRTVVNFGALPVRVLPATSAIKGVAHRISGVNSGTQFTRIYGCASKKTTTTYIPLPYVWPNDAKEDIAVFVDATNVTIVTGDTATWAGYDDTLVVLEYMRT